LGCGGGGTRSGDVEGGGTRSGGVEVGGTRSGVWGGVLRSGGVGRDLGVWGWWDEIWGCGGWWDEIWGVGW